MHLLRSSTSSIVYDEAATRLITYWDNNTALAPAVRSLGLAAQNYAKRHGTAAAFLDAATRQTSAAIAAGSWVRFGQPVRKFSSPLARELGLPSAAGRGAGRLSPLSAAATDAASDVSVWVSQAGVTSTLHYDRFDNLHVLVRGEKRVTLAPPHLETLRRLDVRPGTHPNARQARRSPAQDYAQDETKAAAIALPSALLRARSHDAIFIPAGWLHELAAGERGVAVALSVTARGHELDDFSRLAGSGVSELLPFITASWGTFSAPKLASSLVAYLPELLSRLQLDAAELMHVWLGSYGKESRAESGMPPPGEAPWPHGASSCVPPREAGELAVLSAAASKVASRLAGYRRELLPHYVLLYLDAVLSKVGGAGGAPQILGQMLGLLELCAEELFGQRA